MSIHDDMMSDMDSGLKGRNKGIPMGIKSIGNLLCNLLPNTYYLIGGESSTGKTAFVDTLFCVNPIDAILKGKTDKTLKIFYDSLEISKKRKMAKWSCIKLYKDYNIIMDSKTLLSMRETKVSQEIYDKVKQMRNYFEKVEDFIVFNDHGIHPTGSYYKVKEYCESVGIIKEITKKYKNSNKTYTEKKYIPNNSNEIVLRVTDHIGLLRGEKDAFDVKKKLDKQSHYCVDLRNIYGVSCVEISQFNRDLADFNRQKFKELSPQHADFKGSGNMYEDSDTVIGLFSPKLHGISRYHNYNIEALGNRAIFAFILKNRDGEDSISTCLNFLGEAGYYRQMPSAAELDMQPMLMERAIKFN